MPFGGSSLIAYAVLNKEWGMRVVLRGDQIASVKLAALLKANNERAIICIEASPVYIYIWALKNAEVIV